MPILRETKMQMIEFQTRSDTKGLIFFKTFAAAYEQWKKDDTIWKISFHDHDGKEYRFRPKRISDVWGNLSEEKICSLNEVYKLTSDQNAIFWIDQQLHVICDDYFQLERDYNLGKISIEEYNKIYQDTQALVAANAIVSVMTDEQFNEYIKSVDEKHIL